LENLSKKYPPPAETGMPMVVSLPASNAWAQREGGVRAIIHVVGPNMNPAREDCLHGDYTQGCMQLALTYRNLFRAFYNLCHPEAEQLPYIRIKGDLSPKKNVKPAAAATATLGPMDRFVRLKFDVSSGLDAKPGATVKNSVATSPQKGSNQRDGSWSTKLFDYCKHPEQHQDFVVWFDDRIVIIRDVFPKSKFHFLVMPREIVPTFADLNEKHVPLLRAMLEKQAWLRDTFDPNDEHGFRAGFHAVPSMKQLHMHVISQDFTSDALKNKKHWNSFNTAFFVEASKFIGDLEDFGAIAFDREQYEAMLKEDLKCHRCRLKLANIPKLKDHITKCK
jgi:aprataxin